jgi:hypothetical protein
VTVGPLTVREAEFLVFTLAVRETDAVLAVPLEMYPAVTEGVRLMFFVSVIVFVPEDREAEAPEIVAGTCATPEVIAVETAEG